jgi:hypothetical protein
MTDVERPEAAEFHGQTLPYPAKAVGHGPATAERPGQLRAAGKLKAGER